MLTFLHKKYQSLNEIQLSQSAFRHNYQVLQSLHPTAAAAPLLKSNAYGHGLQKVGKIADTLGAAFLIVDSLYEAYELQKIHVKTKILILGYSNPENYPHFLKKRLPFEFVISDLRTAEILNQQQPGIKVHLFVDTGMCREGITLRELPKFLQKLKTFKHLQVNGLCSHFADADNPKDFSFSEMQIQNFKKALQLTEEAGFFPQWKHLAASAGTLKISDPIFNLYRLGLSFYGLSPLDKSDHKHKRVPLEPVLELRSHVSQLKNIFPGDRVSYNGIFTATKVMKIALLPLGYADGLDRGLSNCGFVKVHGKFCPILGKVCMNITVIDVSKVKNIRVGDIAIIFSKIPTDKNSIEKSSQIANSTTYLLFVHLAASIRRVILT